MQSELGTTLMSIGQPSAAIPHLARVAEELPDRTEAKVNYAIALKQSGDIGVAMAAQRRALAEDPLCRPAWQNLLLGLNYLSGITAEEVAVAHRAYAARFARPAPAPSPMCRAQNGACALACFPVIFASIRLGIF